MTGKPLSALLLVFLAGTLGWSHNLFSEMQGGSQTAASEGPPADMAAR
jgi:hypothetical protein